MRKIVVPEGMLRAMKKSIDSQFAYIVDGHGGDHEDVLEPALEAALRWQRENAPVPTIEQCDEIREAVDRIMGNGHGRLIGGSLVSDGTLETCVEWIRRMYDAPEPEVPEEKAI